MEMTLKKVLVNDLVNGRVARGDVLSQGEECLEAPRD